MFQNRRKISKFAVFMMLALVISGSFCLNFLTMAALAEGMPTHVFEGQPAVQSIKQPASSSCGQAQTSPLDNKMPQTDSRHNNTSIISPLTSSGVLDCCLNKDRSVAEISVSSGFSQYFLVTPIFTAGESISNSFSSSDYCFVILPPPHLVALASIKKNE